MRGVESGAKVGSPQLGSLETAPVHSNTKAHLATNGYCARSAINDRKAASYNILVVEYRSQTSHCKHFDTMSVFFDAPIRLVTLEKRIFEKLIHSREDAIPEGEAEVLLGNIGITEGISMSESGDYRQLLAAVHDVAEHVLALPDYTAQADFEKYPRKNVHRPSPEEQDFGNAWAHKFSIYGSSEGELLKGKTVCLKDNIAVAGVPQFFGTDAISPWTSTSDATVVTRTLEAGAEIVGTTICENFCNSTSSYTSAQGMVHNPYAEGYSAGGSTSGGSALVGGGLVDIAIGADQGGSIRVPSSFCGCK